MVRATGIGYWDKNIKKDKETYLLNTAEIDARKAAVNFVLLGGTDPMLTTEAEKTAFAKVAEEFFAPANIQSFIAWESTELLSRVKREIEKNKKYELHIEKAFKINKSAIEVWLNSKGVKPQLEQLTSALGLPMIMVIPAVKKGTNPIDVLQRDKDLSHAAKVIEGYLTARRYDVIVPEQQASLAELTAAQSAVKDLAEDYSYQLALSIGSDVYITYEVAMENTQYNTQKAIVNCRAYETTTARLLGTETGYSPSAQVAKQVLIENAINDAIDKVLSRIMAYWKEDMNNGVQFKLIVSIPTTYDSDQSEEISLAFLTILEQITKNKRFKENIVTDQTLDYLIWCDPEQYAQSTKLYLTLKNKFKENFAEGTLKKVNLNRKLIQLQVSAE
jgi:hypothetical protein